MRAYLLGLSLVVGVLASCSSVPSGSQSRDSLIEEFLDRSYLRQEVTQQYEQLVQLQSSKVAQTASEAEGLAFSREVVEALRPESVVPLMQDYVRTQRAETLEHLLEWLRTPLAHRMLALAAEPFDYGGFNTYQVPKDELRYELIPRLDKATHTSEWAIADISERTKVLLPLFEGNKQAAQWDGKLSPMIEQFAHAQSMRKLSFIYRTVSGQDLQHYVEFLESSLGQTYVAIRRNALVAANSNAQTVMAKLPGLVQSIK